MPRQVVGDARAALVLADAGGEVDEVVEACEAHRDVGRAASGVLHDVTVDVAHAVDEGLADHEDALAHGVPVAWAWSKSMAL